MTPEEALKIDPARYSVHGDVATALRVLADALREAQAQTVQMREDAARVADEAVKQSRYWANEHSVGRQSWLDTAQAEEEIARDIRRLPAPAARTYDDGVRDAYRAVERQPQWTSTDPGGSGTGTVTSKVHAMSAIADLLSPAPAVAPVAQKHDPDEGCAGCENFRDATSDAERYCGAASFTLMFHDPDEYPAPEWCPKRAPVAAPKPGLEVVAVSTFAPPFDAHRALMEMQDSIARRGMGSDPATLYQVYTAIQDALAAGRGAR